MELTLKLAVVQAINNLNLYSQTLWREIKQGKGAGLLGHASASRVICKAVSEKMTFQSGTWKHITLNRCREFHSQQRALGHLVPQWWGPLAGFIQVTSSHPSPTLGPFPGPPVNSRTCRYLQGL